jgi:phenylacetic acid degradation protein
MPCYAFEGLRPIVDPTAHVHPTAVLIGDVEVGAGCYVGPNASLRGDFGRLVLKPGSNLQDNCTMHSFPGRECVVEEDGHVGHGAVLHGCTLGRNTLIGMNAVVMDNAVVGENAIVGAMAFVRSGQVIPPGTLWVGAPAKQLREVTLDEAAWKVRGTREYQALAQRCLSALAECEPLREAEPNRPKLAGDFTPLSEWRAR